LMKIAIAIFSNVKKKQRPKALLSWWKVSVRIRRRQYRQQHD
jgi:hypothetical protein